MRIPLAFAIIALATPALAQFPPPGVYACVDAAGVTVAFNHDHVSMDPLVVWRVERDGDYVIQVSGHRYPASTELNFAGGADGIYRLQVSDGPVVRHVWPLGVARVEKP